MTRRGASAMELLISSAILAAAFIPIYTLIQSNRKIAFLSENQLVARRIATRALGELEGQLYDTLVREAKGASPPTDVPMMPPEGARIDFSLPDPEQEKELSETPKGMFKGYMRLVSGMQLDVYFHELEPGFGRLAAAVRWKDPSSGQPRSFVAVRFVDAPFHQWRSR